MNDDECTPQEQEARLSVCKTCPRFMIDPDSTTTCTACDCSISLLITFKDQVCPEGKW